MSSQTFRFSSRSANANRSVVKITKMLHQDVLEIKPPTLEKWGNKQKHGLNVTSTDHVNGLKQQLQMLAEKVKSLESDLRRRDMRV